MAVGAVAIIAAIAIIAVVYGHGSNVQKSGRDSRSRDDHSLKDDHSTKDDHSVDDHSTKDNHSVHVVIFQFTFTQGSEKVTVPVRTPPQAKITEENGQPTSQLNPETQTFDVPLIPSRESRCTINFSTIPFKSINGEGDNGTIKIEFVNFGEFADDAFVQAKADKALKEDPNRDRPAGNGGAINVGIGDDPPIDGFYFAIRTKPGGKPWNSAAVLASHPEAFIRVTLVRHPEIPH